MSRDPAPLQECWTDRVVELRFLPLTRSQQPQKVVLPCGCYFDKLKLQEAANLCSSVLSFQLDAAETHQKYSIL